MGHLQCSLSKVGSAITLSLIPRVQLNTKSVHLLQDLLEEHLRSMYPGDDVGDAGIHIIIKLL